VQAIAFTPHITNTGACQMNVDGFGLKGLRPSPGVEFLGGELVQGTPQVALYNNADGVWYVHGIFQSPYNVPLFGGLDFWDTIAPSSAFIFPMGQAISRTTFSRAFARWGTKFGAGDGSNTFNVPDKRERVSVMMADVASRLSAPIFGADSTQLGAVGGNESQALTRNMVPTGITSSGNNAISVQTDDGNVPSNSNVNSRPQTGGTLNTIDGGTVGRVSSSGNNNISVTSNNTGSQAPGGAKNVPIVQPTIVCNYIIRVL